MDTKQRIMEQACAAALCLAALAGCGFVNRVGEREAAETALLEAALPAVYNPDFGIPAVAGVGAIYDIYIVIPPQGPVAGGNPAELRGVFPAPTNPAELAAIEAMYTVYFGNNIAPYDTSVSPYIGPSRINVTVPPGDAPGFVDVIFRDVTTLADAATLYDGYEYLNTAFTLYDVVPGRGWIFGDESADLQGTYPVTNAFSQSLLNNIAGASQFYRVYFDYLDNGGRLAAFDSTVIDPVITASNMYVRSPFGDDVELVDVTIVSHDNGDFSNSQVAQLGRAYKYYAMYLTRVIPNQGPVPGLNTARLEGFLPGLTIVSNIYSAYARYGVYFGGNRANFVDLVGPTPVFQPSVIVNMAARIYTTGFMYVEVPPAVVPGFVDVRIEDLEFNPDLRDDTTICPSCYEYVDEDGVGRWTNAEIFPSPVGKLPPGDLLVRITVTGELTGDDTVFIVPHGGDPDISAHRIPLNQLTAGDVNGEWVWTGTNAEEIPRVMGALLVDGHAAVYLFDTVNDEIIGDDTSDLSDDNRIEGLALEGRHFIIDTIPPRLRLVPLLERLRGDDFVSGDIPGDWSVTGAVDSAGSPPMPLTNPHPFDITALNGFPEVPFAGNWMERPAGLNSKAQVFFRVSSLTNFFLDSLYVNDEPTADLQFNLRVIFEDEDIYTVMGRTPGALDGNRFDNGNTTRLVAGFPTSPVTPQTGRRDEVLVPNSVNQEVLVAWDFQATPFQAPNITGITVDYDTANSPLAAGGNPALSANLAAAPIEMTAEYTLGDPLDATTGAQVEDTGPYSLMSVVFRAVDRAGDYFPQGNTALGRIKIFTANDTSDTEGYSDFQQPEVGPLNLWWLRSTATRVLSNVPPSGDAAAPEFSWETTGPDTETVFDPTDGLGVQRLYSFAIYETDPTQGTRDEQRDGRYTLLSGWSDWTVQDRLTRDDVLAVTNGREGRWFLIVVMSCNEAGDIELWPSGQLVNPTGIGPTVIESVNEGLGTEERNWERWFVPPVGQQVDTRLETYFWHDSVMFNSVPEPIETQFGDAEVIPYPAIRNFNPNAIAPVEVVAGRFTMRLSSEGGPLGLLWQISENGVNLMAGGLPIDIQPSLVVANAYTLVLPTTAAPNNNVLEVFLGTANRQPTYYTFQAQAYVDVNDNNAYDAGTDIIDASPATVQFVVVDNVAEFIQRRKSEDAQPIQETDRPQ